MEIRYYQAQGLHIERLAVDLERMFASQGYQAQHFGDPDHMTVQLRKGDDFAGFLGLRSALTIALTRTPDGVQAMIGRQQWADKAVIGTIGFIFPVLWPLIFTAGAGAVMQASLGSQVVNALDMFVHQQMPGAQRSGGVPPFATWPFQAPGAPAEQGGLVCRNCGAANEPGDKFCMQCGKELAPQAGEKVHCDNCGAEMKAGAAFCTKCGTAVEPHEAQV